ncbi:MAG: ribonuclease R [Wenzhouxiangellaceae bacterium]|nr:ribonuclease R [Wenzhouxiangellaceae bacterium]
MELNTHQLLKLLEKIGRPITRRELSDRLDLDHDASNRELKPLLTELIERGQVVRNRRAAYGVAAQMDLVPGRVSAHADGFGFVLPDDDGDDLFLNPRQMRQVFDGDRVLAAVSGIDRRGRREGQIVEVLERARQQVVGRFVAEQGIAFVVPDDPRLTHDIVIPKPEHAEARPGKIVVARITRQPEPDRAPLGEIVAVLGHADEPGMATRIAIFNHQLPHEFPAEVEAEATAFGDAIDPATVHGRLDLRDLPLVTIDGPDARDFDDAVFAERRRGGGYRLLVAIADVAEYVRPGSALDDEAQARGTSTYFPDQVVPMLPEALSNGLCSLNPGVDRLAMVCEMRLDETGRVTSARFHEAVMRSAARLTYDQARRMVFNEDSADREWRADHEVARANLEALAELYRLLAKRRARRGAIDFDSEEVVFQFASDGRVEGLGRRQRNDAHRLIEECMITANVEAAKKATKIGLPVLYRVHDSPPPDKLGDLEAFLSAHGFRIDWKNDPTPSDLTRIQQRARSTPIAPLVDAVLLRSLALAVYQPENLGHFGLALEAYAHFTSPIRRYPDLLLHRALKHHLRRQKKTAWPYSAPRMAELGRQCSHLERRAEEASREVDDRLKCQFMQRHLGDVFDGIITGVTGFGLFVELVEMGVSGLVHVTALPNDYYHFDPVGRVLAGERRGLRYRLADAVSVEVVSVSVDERKIGFRIAGEADDAPPADAGKPKKKRRGKSGSRSGRRGKPR